MDTIREHPPLHIMVEIVQYVQGTTGKYSTVFEKCSNMQFRYNFFPCTIKEPNLWSPGEGVKVGR